MRACLEWDNCRGAAFHSRRGPGRSGSSARQSNVDKVLASNDANPHGKAPRACYCFLVPGTGSAPSLDALEAREILNALLEAAYGSTEDARAALARALQHSNRAEFPATVAEILVFVRTGLLPVLSEDLGPRLTMTVVEDFVTAHEIRSGVRKKESAAPKPVARVEVRPRGSTKDRRVRVLLVDADRIGRLALARALVREGCEVTVVDSVEELGQVVRSDEEVDVALFDGKHAAKLLLMEVIVERFPGVSLVVRSAGEAATRAVIHALGVARFEVVAGDVSVDGLVTAVLRIARVPETSGSQGDPT
jgi:ActR/RegA family two-component response regulator